MFVRIAVAILAAFWAGAAVAASPSPAPTESETEFARLSNWRVVRVVDGKGGVSCSARLAGPAGELAITRLGAKAWTISVPAQGHEGSVVASIGPEELTLKADGTRAWWKLAEAPYWGDGDPGPYTVVLTGAEPMEWEMAGVQPALKAVARCATGGAPSK